MIKKIFSFLLLTKSKILTSKNLNKKIMAMIGGIFLWYYVDSITTIEKEFMAVIKYINIPDEMILVDYPEKIKYSLKTNKYYPENINADLEFIVSLKNAHIGMNFLKIEVKNEDVLSSYTSISMTDKTVKVVLEKKEEKMISVKPEIMNTLPPDYKLEFISVTPPRIKVKGPIQALKEMKEISTEEIRIDKPGEHTFDAKLSLPGDSSLIYSADTVHIRLQITYNMIVQEILLPVKIINLHKTLIIKDLNPSKILAKISGSYQEVKKVDFKTLFCYIDLSEIKTPGVYKLEIIPIKTNHINISVEKNIAELELKHSEKEK